jgi:hypothetical protein
MLNWSFLRSVFYLRWLVFFCLLGRDVVQYSALSKDNKASISTNRQITHRLRIRQQQHNCILHQNASIRRKNKKK